MSVVTGPVDRSTRPGRRLSSLSEEDRRLSSVEEHSEERDHKPPTKATAKMRLCRVFYRARSRSKRRRCALWVGSLLGAFCLIYFNVMGMNTLNQDQPLFLAKDVHPRKPMAFKPPEPPKKDDELDFDHDLMPDLVPAILHYVWCGRRHFEYRHYLAIRSADRAVRPDKVFFHYEELPVVDQEGYYQWFNDTLQEIDHLLPRPLNYSVCPRSGTAERYILVLDILDKFGGIYIPEDSIWIDFPVHLRTSPLVAGVVATSPTEYADGIIIGKKGGFVPPTTPEELLVVLSLGVHEHGGIKPCVSEEGYVKDVVGDKICVRVERNIFPKDIWEEKSKFAMLSRVVSYGVVNIKHLYSMKNPVPKIGHYVCVDCNIRFTGYLSMLSAIYVAGLSKVYIHGVEKPTGKWWVKLQEDPRFIYVYREYPESVYDKAVMTPRLAVGIMKVAILLKYGGIYLDFSALWTQKIPDTYFGYDAIASPDWHLYGHWPDSINHGVLIAKRNSKYLQKLRTILQKYKSNNYWYNDHYLAYKVVEKDPTLVWLNRRLQVKCLNHNCHPTWQADYKSGLMQNKPGAPFSWENDTLTVHWTDTFPELDLDMVKYTSGIIIDVSRYIFQSAGIALSQA
ncbi:uncharacterized protein LOC124292050 isoform X1 [Haliotis rubra]|uniref:uncharacterized protein LOC124292050 isoform X1 n=2 Tax=Haliotis rubra TaxID=36100 RepID=UPI001EE504F6|nr:uncharacterized protein LOC124292050 isoform X1 [Haliotis rubra]